MNVAVIQKKIARLRYHHRVCCDALARNVNKSMTTKSGEEDGQFPYEDDIREPFATLFKFQNARTDGIGGKNYKNIHHMYGPMVVNDETNDVDICEISSSENDDIEIVNDAASFVCVTRNDGKSKTSNTEKSPIKRKSTLSVNASCFDDACSNCSEHNEDESVVHNTDRSSARLKRSRVVSQGPYSWSNCDDKSAGRQMHKRNTRVNPEDSGEDSSKSKSLDDQSSMSDNSRQNVDEGSESDFLSHCKEQKNKKTKKKSVGTRRIESDDESNDTNVTVVTKNDKKDCSRTSEENKNEEKQVSSKKDYPSNDSSNNNDDLIKNKDVKSDTSDQSENEEDKSDEQIVFEQLIWDGSDDLFEICKNVIRSKPEMSSTLALKCFEIMDISAKAKYASQAMSDVREGEILMLCMRAYAEQQQRLLDSNDVVDVCANMKVAQKRIEKKAERKKRKSKVD